MSDVYHTINFPSTWIFIGLLLDMAFTQFPCPSSVLAIDLFIYYTSVPTGTEVK